ncbi:MAG: fimbrillin family protein [Candidatus Cryptobacteroides sp.]
MKKHLVLGALAVLALAACSKTETLEVNKGNEISLSAVSGKNLTKAADGYCNNNKPNDFVVWASSDSKLYFANETYTFDSGSSTYKSASARYWPASEVNFFALKNQNGTVNFTHATPSLAVTGYTVEATPETQKDFLYAVSKNVTKPAGTPTPAAALNFRHALSQIEFKAKNDNSNIHVVIDKIQVVNVFNKGDFAVSDATTDNYKISEENPHINGDTPISDPRTGVCTWSEQNSYNSKATYVITPKNALNSVISVDVPNGGSADLTVTDPTGQEYNPNTLYLLPQDVAAWNGTGKAVDSDDAYFIIDALIYNVADTKVNKATDVVLWGDNSSGTWKSKPIAVPFPASTTWEGGLRYVYTFNFTSYGMGGSDPGTGDPVLTPITLTVTVDDFVDAGNTDVEVK